MKVKDYWFERQNEDTRPVAIHWKGKMLETLPVVLSAICAVSFVLRLLPIVPVSEALPFFSFSVLAAAQGFKYYFYHEKTK